MKQRVSPPSGASGQETIQSLKRVPSSAALAGTAAKRASSVRAPMRRLAMGDMMGRALPCEWASYSSAALPGPSHRPGTRP